MTNVQRIVMLPGLFFAPLIIPSPRWLVSETSSGLASVFASLLIVGLPTVAVLLLVGWQKKEQVEDEDLEGRPFPPKSK